MTGSACQVEFRSAGRSVALAPGSSYGREREDQYRDAPASIVETVNRRVRAGEPWRDVVRETFAESNPWLYRIVSHPSRKFFFRDQPPPENSLVLDIGAGWGQLALPLARSCQVCALEPTAERLAFIQAAAAQENVAERMFFIQADYLEVDFDTRFDLACCIGVLEWVGAFRPDEDPRRSQIDFLRKIRRDLRPGGTLVLGIENRLGLKYLMGAPDDHTGLAGISVYDAALASRKWRSLTGKELRVFTFSRHELEQMLRAAGFERLAFYAALPDYKLPELILPLGAPVEEFFAGGGQVDEHDGSNGSPLPWPEELKSHYRSLAALGIASNFVPSFYVVAG